MCLYSRFYYLEYEDKIKKYGNSVCTKGIIKSGFHEVKFQEYLFVFGKFIRASCSYDREGRARGKKTKTFKNNS